MLLVGTDEGLIALERARSGWSQAWAALEGYSFSGLARDPTRPGRLLASAYGQGVFLSTDGGQTWRQVLAHNAWTIAVSPDGTAYAGIKPAAVARSRDGGESWEDLTQRVAQLPTYSQWDAPFPPYTAHVRALAVRPGDPQVVYGGVEVGGVIVSRDGGDSWQELRNGVHLDIHGLAVAPSDPWVIYAATGGGFYRSFDAGESWEPAQRGMHHRYNMAVAVHPLEPRTVVTATMVGPSPHVGRAQGRRRHHLPLQGRRRHLGAPGWGPSRHYQGRRVCPGHGD